MLTCLFDIDGTLITTGGAGRLALREALTVAFGVAEPTESVPISGRTDRGITRDMMLHHGIEPSVENWEKFRDAYFVQLPSVLERFGGRVLPGIKELLQTLAARDDVAVGLLTGNTRKGASLKLGHFALADYFEFGGFGDHHLVRDDVAHEALQEVRTRFGARFKPDRLWVIGDTPLDVQCARAINASVIAVETGTHPREELQACQPDALLADLSDPRVPQILGL